jgi:hypothetical protein
VQVMVDVRDQLVFFSHRPAVQVIKLSIPTYEQPTASEKGKLKPELGNSHQREECIRRIWEFIRTDTTAFPSTRAFES